MTEGTVLQFKRPNAGTEGLRFLYIQKYHSCFRLRREKTEFYFELSSGGLLLDGYYCLMQSSEGMQLLEQEDFSKEQDYTLDSVLPEARKISKEQIDSWSDCTPGERIALSIQWSYDIIADLEVALKSHISNTSVRDELDALFDYLLDIEEFQDRIAGLKMAQDCL